MNISNLEALITFVFVLMAALIIISPQFRQLLMVSTLKPPTANATEIKGHFLLRFLLLATWR